MRRWSWLAPVLVVVLALSLVPIGSVFAAPTGTVTINATPSYISITINTTTHDFSTVTAGVDEETDTGYFGVTNGSTVTTDNTIVSVGWESDGTAWTWGAPAEDTAQMKASDGDGTFDVTVDDSTPAALSSGIGATTDWSFELQIDAAASYTHGDAQGTTITISASAA